MSRVKEHHTRRRMLFLSELHPAARFSEVNVDFAFLGTGVSEINRQAIGGGTQLAGCHGSATQILFLIVLGIDRRVPAHNQSPFLFARYDIHGVSASRNVSFAEAEVGLGKECHRRSAGHQHLANGRALAMTGRNWSVVSRQLLAVFKGADGALRLGSWRLLG